MTKDTREITNSATIEKLVIKISTTGKKVKSSDAQSVGKYPVIDQGEMPISGYVDDASKLLGVQGQIIVFGDHSRRIKLVNHDFVPGADGIVVLKPIEDISAELLVYLMEYQILTMRDNGYARHWQHLKKIVVQYPKCKLAQAQIVSSISESSLQIDHGLSSLEKAERQVELYRQSVLKDAFEGKLTADWRAANPALVEPPDKLLARIENERKAAHQAELDAWEDAVNQWEFKGKDGKKPSKPKNLKPIENPPIAQGDKCSDTWCDVKFSDVFNVTGGLTKNADKRKQLTLQMKYLSVANVYADTLKLDNINIIGVTKAEFDKVRLEFGDILIVEGNGSKDQIGRAAIWRDEFPNCGHQNHLIRGRALGSISPEFIMHFLLSGIGRQRIMDVASSTSGLYTLSISKIDSLIIPCPSRTEQDEIVRKLDEILQSCAKVRANIVELRQRSESLKQSILKQAFSGHELLEDAS